MNESTHRWRRVLIGLAIAGPLVFAAILTKCATTPVSAPAAVEVEAPAAKPTKEQDCVLEGRLEMSSADGNELKGPVNAVVYVKWLPRKVWPHKPETKRVTLKDRRFEPRVVVLVQHDSIVFENEDAFEHAVFSSDDVNAFSIPPLTRRMVGTTTFEELGAVRVQCDSHPDERADVLVLQNPVFTYVGADGRWRLGELPAGDYAVGAWEPNGATVESAKAHCDGALEVELPRLQQARPVRPFHKNGTAFEPDIYQ